MRLVTFFSLILSFLLIPLEGKPSVLNRKVAITIDDAPFPSTTLFTTLERAHSTIQKIKSVNAPSIAIFAVGAHIDSFGDADLKAYGAAGHIICNHTYSHLALSKVSAEQFALNIEIAHNMLHRYQGFRPYFRHPYLDIGSPDQRAFIKNKLNAIGYKDGYVTIHNHDWYVNYLLTNAIQKGQKINFEKLGQAYVKMLLDCAAMELYLDKHLGSNHPAHILLLHANDLTALYIDDLIIGLRKRGWKVISAEEAYQLNEVYHRSNSPSELRRAHQYNQNHTFLKLPYLKSLFEERDVFTDAP